MYSYDWINTFANQTLCVSNFQCGQVFKFPHGICYFLGRRDIYIVARSYFLINPDPSNLNPPTFTCPQLTFNFVYFPKNKPTPRYNQNIGIGYLSKLQIETLHTPKWVFAKVMALGFC